MYEQQHLRYTESLHSDRICGYTVTQDIVIVANKLVMSLGPHPNRYLYNNTPVTREAVWYTPFLLAKNINLYNY